MIDTIPYMRDLREVDEKALLKQLLAARKRMRGLALAAETTENSKPVNNRVALKRKRCKLGQQMVKEGPISRMRCTLPVAKFARNARIQHRLISPDERHNAPYTYDDAPRSSESYRQDVDAETVALDTIAGLKDTPNAMDDEQSELWEKGNSGQKFGHNLQTADNSTPNQSPKRAKLSPVSTVCQGEIESLVETSESALLYPSTSRPCQQEVMQQSVYCDDQILQPLVGLNISKLHSADVTDDPTVNLPIASCNLLPYHPHAVSSRWLVNKQAAFAHLENTLSNLTLEEKMEALLNYLPKQHLPGMESSEAMIL